MKLLKLPSLLSHNPGSPPLNAGSVLQIRLLKWIEKQETEGQIPPAVASFLPLIKAKISTLADSDIQNYCTFAREFADYIEAGEYEQP